MFFRRNSKKPLWVMGGIIALLFLLPAPFTQSLRSKAISMTSPLWKVASRFKHPVQTKKSTKRIEKLKLENALLKADPIGQYERAKSPVQATFARVIFRSPSTWNQDLWIDVGTNNANVKKNSPVVLGPSIVGVIDHVEPHKSRVKLITDKTVIPSVRAARGAKQDEELLFHLGHLIDSVQTRDDLRSAALLSALDDLQLHLRYSAESYLLAKGEIQGSGAPLWRAYGETLKGVGFNYSFPDAAGPARDLRSGAPIPPNPKIRPIPILEVGDLLITTGMDGVFPPGLHVGTVTKVTPLKEGSTCFELEANPSASNLMDLTHVYVLPPVEYSVE